MKFDFKHISIITHIRVDTPERLINIHLRDRLYSDMCVNLEFVYVEDDDISKVGSISHRSDVKYFFALNSGPHKKTASYNIGAKLTDRRFLCFLDADCIVHPDQILDSAQVCESACIGVSQPYSGVALYLNYKAKSVFTLSPTFETLNSMTPPRFETNLTTPHLLIGNTQAPGGCVLMKRDAFDVVNGFNPFFLGWGYEDNELLTRVHNLGLQTHRLSSADRVLWHLPHDAASVNKSLHSHYSSNRDIYNAVNCMTREELKEYIKRW